VTFAAYGGRMPETRHDLRAAVAARRPVDARERQSVGDFLRHFDSLDDPFSETASPVHVTGSAILVSEDRTRVLLHQHKRLGLWLQPGGHIDPGELPWDGSLREASEETGLPVVFAGGEPQLVHLDVHPGPRKHTHLDLRYLVESPLVPPARASAAAVSRSAAARPSSRGAAARTAIAAPICRRGSAASRTAAAVPNGRSESASREGAMSRSTSVGMPARAKATPASARGQRKSDGRPGTSPP